jgi:hypothetical protein
MRLVASFLGGANENQDASGFPGHLLGVSRADRLKRRLQSAQSSSPLAEKARPKLKFGRTLFGVKHDTLFKGTAANS